MAKTITIKNKDKEYTLEYTRRSIEQMERNGFRTEDLDDKPVSTLPKFFAGAFIANHPFAKAKDIDEIFMSLPNKEELLQNLIEMYSEPINALMDEPDANSKGNLNWQKNW